MNSWSGVGSIVAQPTLRQTSNGRNVLNFKIVVNRSLAKNLETIPIVVFGEEAAHQAKYLQRGTKIAVIGTLRSRMYIDSFGATHNTFEIQATSIDWLDNVNSPKIAEDTLIA